MTEPLLKSIFQMPQAPAAHHRRLARDAMNEAIAAGTFRLTEVLTARQPARDRAMEELTDNVQTKSTVDNSPRGFREALRIYVKVEKGEHDRVPHLTRAKQIVPFGDEERTGEKLWRSFPPGTYLLSMKEAISILSKHGIGVVDQRGLRSGLRRAMVTEVGYEFEGRGVNTEHLAATKSTHVAERVTQAVTTAAPAVLPPAGAALEKPGRTKAPAAA